MTQRLEQMERQMNKPKGKLSLYILMSIDGKIARENGDVDWIFTEEQTKNEDLGYLSYYSTINSIITGRKTWEVSKKLEEKPFSGKTKYVFTRNHELTSEDDEEVKYIHEEPSSFVRKLKEEKEGEKLWLLGGGEIIQELHDAKLIDEMIITVQPTILGRGIPLWNNIQSQSEWQLTNLEKWSCGLVQLCYTPKPIIISSDDNNNNNNNNNNHNNN